MFVRASSILMKSRICNTKCFSHSILCSENANIVLNFKLKIQVHKPQKTVSHVDSHHRLEENIQSAHWRWSVPPILELYFCVSWSQRVELWWAGYARCFLAHRRMKHDDGWEPNKTRRINQIVFGMKIINRMVLAGFGFSGKKSKPVLLLDILSSDLINHVNFDHGVRHHQVCLQLVCPVDINSQHQTVVKGSFLFCLFLLNNHYNQKWTEQNQR